jgi:hypothetical protein
MGKKKEFEWCALLTKLQKSLEGYSVSSVLVGCSWWGAWVQLITAERLDAYGGNQIDQSSVQHDKISVT